MRATLLTLAFLAPAAAHAACETPVFSCTHDDGARTIEVCNLGADLTYSFGISGREADLVLTVPLSAGTYSPWPGVGSAIWESVRFQNESDTLEVWASIERGVENAVEDGGVLVIADDQVVAELVCDPGSVTSDFAGLSDAMYASGLCWNNEKTAWTEGGCE